MLGGDANYYFESVSPFAAFHYDSPAPAFKGSKGTRFLSGKNDGRSLLNNYIVIPSMDNSTRIPTPGSPPTAQIRSVARLYPRSGLPIQFII